MPEDYYDDSPGSEADEWQPGDCDHCLGGDENGITADGPLGPIYCACFIGQGADEENCQCGPEVEDA
jgi:hypothetical protein